MKKHIKSSNERGSSQNLYDLAAVPDRALLVELARRFATNPANRGKSPRGSTALPLRSAWASTGAGGHDDVEAAAGISPIHADAVSEAPGGQVAPTAAEMAPAAAEGAPAAADDDALDEQEAKGFRMYCKAKRSRVDKHMPHFPTDEILVELNDRWDARSKEQKHKYTSLAATRDDECMR